MYKKIIIFSGSYPIDRLGATKTIDVGLAKSLIKIGYDVTLIACGKCSLENINFIEIKIDLKLGVFERIIRKIGFGQFFQLKRNKKVDIWVSSYLKKHTSLLSHNTVFIGRAGMSLHSFIEAKKQNALTILHSSWMHPFTQQNILRKEYKILEIKSEPIPKERINIQLKEIEVVDKIWGISNLVYDSYMKNGVSKSKLFNLPLGVDFAYYSIKKKEELSVYIKRETSFKIIFVGQINYEKGAHLLLEALKNSKLHDIEIIFNGSLASNFSAKFQEYNNKLNKKNIKIKISPGNPLKNYKDASVFILPSIHESFGLVVLEAMASGLPVIVSNSVGAKDCIVDNKTGFIFESHNVEHLKNKIEYMYFNRKEIEFLGRSAAEIARQYDWENVSLKFKNYLYNIKN